MFEKEKAPYEIKQDRAAFLQWLHAANDVPGRERSYALSLMGRALREELSEKQLTYITAYYVDGLTMFEIAEKYGVERSTVSRTRKRGRDRIAKVVRYASPDFLNASLGGKPEIPGRRRNKKGGRHDHHNDQG